MKPLFSKCITLIILLGNTFSIAQQPNYPTQAEKAELIYSDLENFVIAFKALEQTTDTVQTLNTLYFDKASIGLKEYINRHGLTPLMLRNAIRKNSEKYAKIETFIDGLEKLKPEIGNLFKKFQSLVPETMFAPTYLLVGANRGIAQASQYGQLVTITRILENKDKLLHLIIHELAHFQQAKTLGGPQYVALYTQPNNLLGVCLREGGAEFITNQVCGKIAQEEKIAYFNKNESDLRKRFLKDIREPGSSFWLWESNGEKEHPLGLGYVMGYKIWNKYYSLVEDREQVIKEILSLSDAHQYIEKSSYFVE
jgi:hypothetical protein